MTVPAARLDAALGATWPAAEDRRTGPFALRRGDGGGQRVSAATLEAPDFDDAALDAAMDGMRAWGQRPIFRVREGEAALDAALAARGCELRDPTLFLDTQAAELARRPIPPLTAMTVWPPLAIMVELWEAGGIGAGRRAVMDRVRGPKLAILGRVADRPAGVAFAAAHGDIAMVHALDVRPAGRRAGLASHMMARAAIWALGAGCTRIAVAVTEANAPARALYADLGMRETARYHYRVAPEPHTTAPGTADG